MEQFPFTFPQAIDLAKHTGYLPAEFRNEDSGFEFSVSKIIDIEEVPDEVQAQLPSADARADFRFYEMHECLAATVAAGVLASLTGGAFNDPQEDGRTFFGEEALAEAHRTLEAAIEEGRQDAIRHPWKLSLSDWAQAFQESMQRVHPDYRLNRGFRGRMVECLRQDATGLYLSQNCGNMHGTWRHCFALLLTSKMIGHALNNPFVIGSRFGYDTIATTYNTDYRAGMKWQVVPDEWRSEYPSTRHGAQEAESAARSAEQFLPPVYMRQLASGSERLVSLYRDAVRFIEEWGISEDSLRLPKTDGVLATEFDVEFGLDATHKSLLPYFNAVRLADANGFSGVRTLNHRRAAANTSCRDIVLPSKKFMEIPTEIRNIAVFVNYIELFMAVREELPGMIEILERVKDAYPRSSAKPEQRESEQRPRPWWRLW